MSKMSNGCVSIDVVGFGILPRFAGEIFVGKSMKDGLTPVVVDLTNCSFDCEMTVVPTDGVKDFISEYRPSVWQDNPKKDILPATGWYWV